MADDTRLSDDGTAGEADREAARGAGMAAAVGGLGLADDGDDNGGGNADDNDDEDAVSDADSDYLELQADIARLDASRRAFLSEHLGADYDERRRQRPDQLAGPGPGPGPGPAGPATVRRRRGPRKAAEPSGEVKLRLQQAHQLFMDHRYEDALAALHEIIRVNAETHAAWSLLASINEDLGRREEAMMAKVFAAHLEPKNVAGWLSTADYALAEAAAAEEGDYDGGHHGDGADDDDDAAAGRQNRRLQNLQIARLCYSGAIRADKDNIAARLGKANVCLEFGQATNAATEYVRVLKRRPLALQVIRNLAEASYDSVRGAETIEAAIRAYRRAVAYLRGRSRAASHSFFAPALQLDDGEAFSWMDVTIYVELFAALDRYAEAIAVLKTLARWMLGRGGPDEAYWQAYGDSHDDDCEWDRHDAPRRRQVPAFQRGRYPPATYGEGLPVDLRAKLAIYRLKLGHEDEAIDAGTTESMRMYPHLLKEVGAELFEAKRFELALQYLELYRDLNRSLAAELHGLELGQGGGSGGGEGGVAAAVAAGIPPDSDDADALVLQGKCNLELHDHAAAEECFLAAIEADDENIDARFELAKMYETAQEKEQAYILVNEALSLEAAQQRRQQQQQQQQQQHQQHHHQDDEDGPVRDQYGTPLDDDNAAAGPDEATAAGASGGGGASRRGPMTSLETAAYRVFLNSEGKVVRRRRKFRKGPDGQEILISAEQKRLSRAAARHALGSAEDGGEDGDGGGGAGRGKPPAAGGARGGAQALRKPGHGQQQRRPRVLRGGGRSRRLFASPAEQAEFEAATSARLRARYQHCQEVKERADAGDGAAAAEWMEAAKELIDDFRSFREFYTWDKYVQFLGVNNFLHDRGTGHGAAEGGPQTVATVTPTTTATATATAVPAVTATAAGQHSSHLAALAERLHQNLTPADAEGGGTPRGAADRRRDYRGIPFDDWLALFLEYALALAHHGRTAAAYAVCQSAHDSTVYRQEDSMFLIHLTWAACAVRAGDEQTCVAVARYFMRDRPFTTDCYRLFTAMCRLCRSPSVWFSSSPAQKYILRQIRHRDEVIRAATRAAEAAEAAAAATGAAASGAAPIPHLDTCLLVVYGHILFASMSYHFALNYYQRALAVDPGNPVISLCIGLSYVHWALKRQAENRQYLLTQGLNFLYRYAELRLAGPVAGPADGPAAAAAGAVDRHARREAFYNLGRTYHLLGLHALAAEFYGKVLRTGDEAEDGDGDGDGGHRGHEDPAMRPDLRTEAAYNLRTYYLLAGNQEAAMQITRAFLVM